MTRTTKLHQRNRKDQNHQRQKHQQQGYVPSSLPLMTDRCLRCGTLHDGFRMFFHGLIIIFPQPRQK